MLVLMQSNADTNEIPTFSILLGSIQRVHPDHKLRKREDPK